MIDSVLAAPTPSHHLCTEILDILEDPTSGSFRLMALACSDRGWAHSPAAIDRIRFDDLRDVARCQILREREKTHSTDNDSGHQRHLEVQFLGRNSIFSLLGVGTGDVTGDVVLFFTSQCWDWRRGGYLLHHEHVSVLDSRRCSHSRHSIKRFRSWCTMKRIVCNFFLAVSMVKPFC